MAEGSKDYGKLFQKNFHRTVEKMMNTIGKADKTVDEDMDRLIAVFTEQQNTANRLQKELQKYMAQAKAMSAVSFGMYQAISSAYETDWEETETFHRKSDNVGQTVWADLLSRMEEQVVQPLADYVNQFSEMKNKIAKHGRKLMDYDIARHNVHSLENAKKRNEFKCTQAHDELIAAKTVYETLKEELYKELPALYECRVEALCSWFEAMLSSEKHFANQCFETKDQMADLARRTKSTASERSHAQSLNNYGSPDANSTQRKSAADEVFRFPACTAMNNIGDSKQQNEYAELPCNTKAQERESSANTRLSAEVTNGGKGEKPKERTSLGASFSSTGSSGSSAPTEGREREFGTTLVSGTRSSSSGANIPQSATLPKETAAVRTSDVELKSSNLLKSAWMEESESSFVRPISANVVADKKVLNINGASASSVTLLYKAVATNSYTADDVEELTFDAGDIIDVIQPSEEEEMDEGWLLGVNTANGKRGLFPSNFTRKI